MYTEWDVEAPVEELLKVCDFLTKCKNGRPLFYNRIARENTFIPQQKYRGRIAYFCIEDGTLFIGEQSNFPQIVFIKAILDHLIEGKYELKYIADTKNEDEYFSDKEQFIGGKYKLVGEEEVEEIDAILDEIGCDTFCLKRYELRKLLQKLLNSDSKDLDILIQELKDSKYSEELSVYRWSHVTTEELEGYNKRIS